MRATSALPPGKTEKGLSEGEALPKPHLPFSGRARDSHRQLASKGSFHSLDQDVRGCLVGRADSPASKEVWNNRVVNPPYRGRKA